MCPWRLMINSSLSHRLAMRFQEQEPLFALGQCSGAAAAHSRWSSTHKMLVGSRCQISARADPKHNRNAPLGSWWGTLTSCVTTRKGGTSPYSPSHPWEGIARCSGWRLWSRKGNPGCPIAFAAGPRWPQQKSPTQKGLACWLAGRGLLP